MRIIKSIRRRMISKLLPLPVQVRHAEYSMIFSADDDISQPSKYLISLAMEAVGNAQKVSLDDINTRAKGDFYGHTIWPGEIYKLLAGLILALKPEVVIEIGTATGLSALIIKKYLPQHSKIATFDIAGWKSYPTSWLQEDDFSDGKLIQYVEDLSDPSVVKKHCGLLEKADMIFIDAEKDGIMEERFLNNFKTVSFKKKPVILFDDIRLWKMLKFWRGISMPKLDLTSFGHWSGTGLVEWR